MRKIEVHLVDDIQTALTSLSQQTGRPEATLIQEAIEAYVKQQTRPALRSLGLGASDTVRAREVESWLEENYRPT